MELRAADFVWDEIEPRVASAGVIPVYIDPAGAATILLGKESVDTTWIGSDKWSAFEGGRDPNETVERSAAREFVEESVCAIQIASGVTPTVESVETHLLQRQYVARIVLCVVHPDDPGEYKYRVSYLVQVPEQPGCVDRFAALHAKLTQFEIARKLFWQRANITTQRYPAAGRIIQGLIDAHKLEGLQDVTAEDDALRLTYLAGGDDECTVRVPKACGAHQYEEWFAHLRHLQRHAEALDSFMVGLHNDVHLACPYRVNAAFLEKKEIKAWSLAELDAVMRDGGRFGHEYFRPYFLPMLQSAIAELRQCLSAP